jgi:hypothetical protein
MSVGKVLDFVEEDLDQGHLTRRGSEHHQASHHKSQRTKDHRENSLILLTPNEVRWVRDDVEGIIDDTKQCATSLGLQV